MSEVTGGKPGMERRFVARLTGSFGVINAKPIKRFIPIGKEFDSDSSVICSRYKELGSLVCTISWKNASHPEHA